MNGRTVTKGILAVALALAAVGCESSTSVTGAATGTARVLMSRDTNTTGQLVSLSGDAGRPISSDTVQSLFVTVVGIDLLQADSADTTAADTSDMSEAWTSIALADSFDLDLMALPADSAAAQLVASGAVAAGTYTRVRLRVTNPRIVFKGDVSFGVGDSTLTGGTEYAVEIPSSAQTGLKVAVGVQVDADATSTIGLVFDADQSLLHVAVTGTGKVMLSPVIRAR